MKDIEHTLGLLRVQAVAQKFSSVPPKELKSHSEELKQSKAILAQIPPATPGYWPTAFQVIKLVSQSSFPDLDKVLSQPESTLKDVIVNPPGSSIINTSNSRFFLVGRIQGVVFTNAVIRFDPNVQLVDDLFINCVFLLPAQDNPSKPLQEIGKTLLASDVSNVRLNTS